MMVTIPEELVMLKQLARRFVSDELIPYEMSVPEGESTPAGRGPHLEKLLREVGLWSFDAPVELGGGGIGALGQTLVTEEFSRVPFVFMPGGSPPQLLYACQGEQREKYLLPIIRGEKRACFALTEPTGGSDPGGNTQTEAVRDGDHWVLNGHKVFISGGAEADFAVVFAVTDRERRQRGGMSAFIVEKGTPGFTVVRTIPTMGGLAPAELDFQDCIVPDVQRLGSAGEGFIVAQQLLGGARRSIGARGVGMADRLIEMGVRYAANRVTFGQPIAERQGVQWMLADSAMEMQSCRWLTYNAAMRADAGEDTRMEDSMAKVIGSEMMGRVADRVMQIHGGWGYSKDLPIERFYRLARMWRIVEGPNEVHRWTIARSLLRSGLAPLREF